MNAITLSQAAVTARTYQETQRTSELSKKVWEIVKSVFTCGVFSALAYVKLGLFGGLVVGAGLAVLSWKVITNEIERETNSYSLLSKAVERDDLSTVTKLLDGWEGLSHQKGDTNGSKAFEMMIFRKGPENNESESIARQLLAKNKDLANRKDWAEKALNDAVLQKKTALVKPLLELCQFEPKVIDSCFAYAMREPKEIILLFIPHSEHISLEKILEAMKFLREEEAIEIAKHKDFDPLPKNWEDMMSLRRFLTDLGSSRPELVREVKKKINIEQLRRQLNPTELWPQEDINSDIEQLQTLLNRIQ